MKYLLSCRSVWTFVDVRSYFRVYIDLRIKHAVMGTSAMWSSIVS